MGMKNESPIEPFAVNEYFVDGFTDFDVHSGVLTCTGYRTHRDPHMTGETVKVSIMKIVCPVPGAYDAVDQARHALSALPIALASIRSRNPSG